LTQIIGKFGEKKDDLFSKSSQKENIFVKMGKLFTHFEEKKTVFFSKFSYDFCQCVGRGVMWVRWY